MLARAFRVSLKAAFADSPPSPNFAAMSLALNPILLNPSAVLSEPSIARIENSFTASPTLSRLKAPLSAPF